MGSFWAKQEQEPQASQAKPAKRAQVLIIGDIAVGKTSLIKCFVSQNTQRTGNTRATIGCEIHERELQLGDERLKITVLDVAGDLNMQNLVAQYARTASLVIMAYAINNHDSFSNLDEWLDSL